MFHIEIMEESMKKVALIFGLILTNEVGCGLQIPDIPLVDVSSFEKCVPSAISIYHYNKIGTRYCCHYFKKNDGICVPYAYGSNGY